MATNRLVALALVLASGAAWSREEASVSECQAAASKPAIAGAKAAVERTPGDLSANFGLADAWSDAGCFSEAVQVLQGVQGTHPNNKELDTRLRVARSLVGEEHYFDTLDRADAQAKVKRDSFRCNNLGDLDACSEAVRLKPDDPALLTAQADALVHAKRPAEAVAHYRRAAALAPSAELTAKLNAAEAQASGGRATVASTSTPAASEESVAPAARPAATAAAPAAAKPQKPIRVARAESSAPALAPTQSPAPTPRLANAGGSTRRYSNEPQGERSH